MKKNTIIKTCLYLCAVLCLVFAPVLGLRAQAPDNAISWKAELRPLEDSSLYELVLSGRVVTGWHTYSCTSPVSPLELTLTALEGCSAEGELYDITVPAEEDGLPVFYGKFSVGQKIRVEKEKALVAGHITWMACDEFYCTSVTDTEFSVTAGGAGAGRKAAAESDRQSSSLWALILEAILWGLAMLLTPCVFPMVPMTVSFFLKGSGSASVGRFKASMYGLFIVLLYTVPISVIILLTWLFGGDAVTADIFNWLATHWVPNLIFFIVFMLFAASFFGAFEITLPSSLINGSDRNSDRKGLAGVFFMALTLVLVSFSCTGPIVGSVLIRSTGGEFWTPMVTMLAFSVAFALPFTLLAFFPSLLGKLKNGSWLNSVKIVLGFVEIALGFKFLSVADQTYHWGILDREVYLAIWIAVFTLLGLYLLGKIRFPHDDLPEKPLSVFRLGLVITVFSFVLYMLPGLWGAPLKALSGYLPPIETQDFVVTRVPPGIAGSRASRSEGQHPIALGLNAYYTIEEGLEASVREGKPVFVDITGHGCVNCREMEQRVWSRQDVFSLLRDSYIIVALYTDDKTALPEESWVTLDNGRVLKDMGRVNSWIVRQRFNVNAQPNYAILGSDGSLLLPVRGYNLDAEDFAAFLRSGLEIYGK